MSIRSQIYRAHQDRVEAFKCHALYLTKVKKMERLSTREFRMEDGSRLVLPKKSKFGGVLRSGKQVKGQTARNRFAVRDKALILTK